MFLSAEQGGGRNYANCKPWRWTSGCPRRTADDNVERRAALDGHRSSFAGVQAVIVSTIPVLLQAWKLSCLSLALSNYGNNGQNWDEQDFMLPKEVGLSFSHLRCQVARGEDGSAESAL